MPPAEKLRKALRITARALLWALGLIFLSLPGGYAAAYFYLGLVGLLILTFLASRRIPGPLPFGGWTGTEFSATLALAVAFSTVLWLAAGRVIFDAFLWVAAPIYGFLAPRK